MNYSDQTIDVENLNSIAATAVSLDSKYAAHFLLDIAEAYPQFSRQAILPIRELSNGSSVKDRLIELLDDPKLKAEWGWILLVLETIDFPGADDRTLLKSVALLEDETVAERTRLDAGNYIHRDYQITRMAPKQSICTLVSNARREQSENTSSRDWQELLSLFLSGTIGLPKSKVLPKNKARKNLGVDFIGQNEIEAMIHPIIGNFK